MRLVLISDSHGNSQGVDKIFQTLKFDYLFFMGDGLSDLGNYEYLDNVIKVSGNCDFFSREVNERILEIGGYNFLITHGNKYGVKLGIGKLVEYAKNKNVQFVFYGHTHIQRIEQIDNIYFINPGKFAKNREGESCGLIIDSVKEDVKISEFKV